MRRSFVPSRAASKWSSAWTQAPTCPRVTGMLGGGTALGWRGQKRPQPNYIWVSEPWPLGVVMLSQVPLATYFQACGS